MNDDKRDLISKLFALLTAKSEDCASQAFLGQGHKNDPMTTKCLVDKIRSAGEEIVIISEAAGALIECHERQA